MVGLHAWRVVIFSTMFHSTMCWDCIFALPWFELGTQFSWVQIELPLLFSQYWNRSTSLFSSSESSLNTSLAKSLRSLQHRSSGCIGGRAPHIFISNWKITFTSHCFSTFWRDRKSLCTVLVMQPLCPGLMWLFSFQAAFLAAILILQWGAPLALRLHTVRLCVSGQYFLLLQEQT